MDIFREHVDVRAVAIAFEPERRLMLATLRDAIRTVLKRRTACRRHLAEAEAWLADDDVDWPFSFVNICDALDLDVRALRTWIMRQGGRPPAGARRTATG